MCLALRHAGKQTCGQLQIAGVRSVFSVLYYLFSLKNNFEWMAFNCLNCFCYYFISPLKAKESKLEMQETFITEFAEVELQRKSMVIVQMSFCF